MPNSLDYQSPVPPHSKPSKVKDFLLHAAGALLAILFWMLLLAWSFGLFTRDWD